MGSWGSSTQGRRSMRLVAIDGTALLFAHDLSNVLSDLLGNSAQTSKKLFISTSTASVSMLYYRTCCMLSEVRSKIIIFGHLCPHENWAFMSAPTQALVKCFVQVPNWDISLANAPERTQINVKPKTTKGWPRTSKYTLSPKDVQLLGSIRGQRPLIFTLSFAPLFVDESRLTNN